MANSFLIRFGQTLSPIVSLYVLFIKIQTNLFYYIIMRKFVKL